MDDRSWILKTHYPYVYPFTMPMKVSTAIILVRNPFDVITSLF
jgi:hypothetical protein